MTTLNSDHLLIIVGLNEWFFSPPSKSGPRCFTNYRKADWPTFTTTTEQLFSSLPPPTSVSQGQKTKRKIIFQATEAHIPRGRVPSYQPGLTPETRSLIQKKDAIRREDPTNPRLPSLNHTILKNIDTNIAQNWRGTMSFCSTSLNPRKYWRTLNNLSGKRSHQDPNQSITFNNQIYTKSQSVATHFCRKFTSQIPYHPNPHTRHILKQIRK